MDSFNIVQLIVFGSLICFGIFLIRQSITLNKERRISWYSIDPVKYESDSIFDKIYIGYCNFINKVSLKFEKNRFISNMASRYSKYVLVGDDIKLVSFIVNKIMLGILFILVVLFSYAFYGKNIGIFEMVLFFIIGYFGYDLYLIYTSKKRIKDIKRDMLRAVMIMNNAFKSGKSTMQAVYIASRELPYPINHEFKRIYQDLKYGLGVDVVFDRFAKRVNIEEASYLASSLTILNKTGGNIISVFNFIEKTLFDKKKLEEELKNLTGASNLVVKILLFVPFVFVGIIYVFNPSYFEPLFGSLLGYMILGLIFILFLIYVFILQKVMKVRI